MVAKKQPSKGKNNITTLESVEQYADLLEIQLKSFRDFFQLGVSPENRTKESLCKVFMEHFPIEDLKKTMF